MTYAMLLTAVRHQAAIEFNELSSGAAQHCQAFTAPALAGHLHDREGEAQQIALIDRQRDRGFDSIKARERFVFPQDGIIVWVPATNLV